jgi:hypothetical protein
MQNRPSRSQSSSSVLSSSPSLSRSLPSLSAALAAAAVALSFPADAHAELSQEAQDLTFGFREYEIAVRDAKESGYRAISQFREPAESCTALIQKAKEIGVRPDEQLNGLAGPFPFKRTAQLCATYRTWKRTLDGAALLDAFYTMAPNLETIKPGDYGDTAVKNWGIAAKKCVEQVGEVISAGADATQKIKDVYNLELSLTEGQQFCQRILDWSDGFAAESKRVAEEKAAAIRAKYTKLGITGDRLDNFVYYDNVQWMVAGCVAQENLQKLKRAPVLFQWLEHNDGTYGVRRFQFRGDKLVRTSEQRYLTSAAATRGCR